MSLTAPQLLGLLAAAQGGVVAVALAGQGDANYAAGTAATTAGLLALLAPEVQSAAAREAAADAAARDLIGAAAGRDARAAALGNLLEAAEAAGDRAMATAVWAVLAGEAEVDWAALGLPL